MRDSPETEEIFPSDSSSEKVEDSALKIGKTNSFEGSKVLPIPVRTIGLWGTVKIFFMVLCFNGSNKF